MSEKVDKGKDKIIQDQREDDSLSRRDFIKKGCGCRRRSSSYRWGFHSSGCSKLIYG